MIALGIFFSASFAAVASPMDREVKCLAEAIYYEAKSEPVAGKYAVAQVVKNRAESPDYPNTICKVVYQRNPRGCQFSWVCTGLHKLRRNPQQWDEAVEIAQKTLLFEETHPIIERKNGLFFHASYVKPAWLKTKRVIAKIGNHIFYGERKYADNKRTDRRGIDASNDGSGSGNAAVDSTGRYGYVPPQRWSGNPEPIPSLGRLESPDTAMASGYSSGE